MMLRLVPVGPGLHVRGSSAAPRGRADGRPNRLAGVSRVRHPPAHSEPVTWPGVHVGSPYGPPRDRTTGWPG